MTGADPLTGLSRTTAHVIGSAVNALDDALADGCPWPDALNALRIIEWAITDRIERLVTKAREDGASWTEIGTALGMTRQAAQQRFGTRT